ncbi:unnamed protein product [Linum trigynum]|uniref:Uncharacterized protein n=1 Tax=Linum trigynum TaxID=586398 RepID=A0AAV2G603_9ROSI
MVELRDESQDASTETHEEVSEKVRRPISMEDSDSGGNFSKIDSEDQEEPNRSNPHLIMSQATSLLAIPTTKPTTTQTPPDKLGFGSFVTRHLITLEGTSGVIVSELFTTSQNAFALIANPLVSIPTNEETIEELEETRERLEAMTRDTTTPVEEGCHASPVDIPPITQTSNAIDLGMASLDDKLAYLKEFESPCALLVAFVIIPFK